MNAAVEVMQEQEPDIITQALSGLDRSAFERADQEIKDADESIRVAEQNLHRLKREAEEAKAAYAAWERVAAQAQLEGRTPEPYSGPSPADAQRMYAVGISTLEAMKFNANHAVARRASARVALRKEVQKRLAAAYCALAEELASLWNALELTGDHQMTQPYVPAWHRLAIPSPDGVPGDDTSLYLSNYNAVLRREGIRTQLRGIAPEVVR